MLVIGLIITHLDMFNNYLKHLHFTDQLMNQLSSTIKYFIYKPWYNQGMTMT